MLYGSYGLMTYGLSLHFIIIFFHNCRIDEDIIESKLAEFRASLVQKDAENGKDTTTYETDEYGRIV